MNAEHTSRITHRKNALHDVCSKILQAPVSFVWEIGSGHGHFLTKYATDHPTQNCIGIDIVLDRVRRAERKRERACLENIHFLHADARDFVEVMPAEARLSAVYMLFPDPWPKRRHHKNRLLEPVFLGAVAKRAGQGMPFYFRTDHTPYFEEAKATFAEHPDWKIRLKTEWPFDMATVFQQKAAAYHSLVAERK